MNHFIDKYILLKYVNKEDILKYLHLETNSYEMTGQMLVWVFLFNAVSIPAAICGVWFEVTIWSIVIIVPLDVWAFMIFAFRKKYYKTYTLWMGVYMFVLSWFLLLAITKIAQYSDSIIYGNIFTLGKLFWMLFVYFSLLLLINFYMFALLHTGFFSDTDDFNTKKRKIKTKTIAIPIIIIVAIGMIVIFVFHTITNIELVLVGFLAGIFGSFSYKIHQYFMMKRFNAFPPYMGTFTGEEWDNLYGKDNSEEEMTANSLNSEYSDTKNPLRNFTTTPCPNCGGKLEEKRGKEYLRANSETVHQIKYQCAKCGKIYTAERLERE